MTLLKNAFVVATVLAAQGTNAWTFKWRDESGAITAEAGDKAIDCKGIEHAEGKLFEWDPKGDDLCITMYADDLCEEKSIGLSCGVWNKQSSRDVTAFMVEPSKDGDGDATSSGGASASDDASASGDATASGTGDASGTASETGSASASGTETGSASEATDKHTGKPTKTGSAPVETVTPPNQSATANPSKPAQSATTDAPPSTGVSDTPASETQTGAASPTGAPLAGIFGALAAVAAVAL